MKTKNMKKIIATLIVTLFLSSCGVQQFQVNSNFKSFSEGGRVFGEKTSGKEYNKELEWFIIGINISHVNSADMAKEINANSYTVETKRTFWSNLLWSVSYGIVTYKKVKVIKRQS